MADAIITKQYLTDIADAIRLKNGKSITYKPSEMAAAINELEIVGADALKLIRFMPQYAISDLGFTWVSTAEENTA